MALACIALACAGGAPAQDPEFAPAPNVVSGLTGLVSIDIADIDGDGDRDLLAATGTGGSIVWFESDGNTNPLLGVMHTIDGGVFNAQFAAAADVDGDGDRDIIAAVRTGNTFATWYENTGGLPPVFQQRTLGSLSSGDLGTRVNAARTADIDGDGDTDVVVSYYVNQTSTQGHVVWYESDGLIPPTFTVNRLVAPVGTLENVSDLRIADLNGDGARDIAAVSETPGIPGGRNRVVWWLSSGGANPTFSFNTVDNALIDPVAIATANLAGGSAIDLAVAAAGSNQVVVFQNSGGGSPTFSPVTGVGLNNPRSVIALDVEGDGDSDLAVTLGTGVQALILESSGPPMPAFTPRPLGTVGGFCADIASGDISGDGAADLAVVFPGSGRVDWFEQVSPIQNIGAGTQHSTFAGAIAAASPGNILRIPEARLGRDPTIDLAGKALVLESDGAFELGQESVLQLADNAVLTAAPGKAIVLDGQISQPAGSGVTISGDIGATFRSPWALGTGASLSVNTDAELTGPRETKRILIDGDSTLGSFPNFLGRPIDAVAITLPSGEAGVAVVGDDPGGLAQPVPAGIVVYAPDPLSGSGWTGYPIDNAAFARFGPVAAGDLNGDGLEDLATIRLSGGIPQLRVHYALDAGTPTFVSSTVSTGIDAQHLALADLDFDGDTDIVSGQGWFRSSGGASPAFAYIPFPTVSSLRSFGLVVGDFDLDGGRDVAVHVEKRTVGIPGRVGYRLYVLRSSASPSPTFSPVLIQERDLVLSGDCSGAFDCYPEVSIELDGLNTLSREDADKDGLTDLFLCEDDGVTLLTNLGAGVSFSASVLTSQFAYDELTPIDLDGDQDIDLLASSMRTSRLRLIENTGSGFEVLERVKPVLRASAAAVLSSDELGVSQIAFVGTAGDRVEIIDRTELPVIQANSATFGVAGDLRVLAGDLQLSGGQVSAGGDLLIGPRGVLRGGGVVFASVWNAGQVRPKSSLKVVGDYHQFLPGNPAQPGVLGITLRDESPLDIDVLDVTGTASLAGGLVVIEEGNFIPAVGSGVDVVLADDLDNAFVQFEVVHMPRLTVLDMGDPAIGTTMPQYNDFPGGSSVRLVPRTVGDPNLGERPFIAHATPADAVVFDLTGGPGGAPDGFADTAIAYPIIEEGPPLGAVAVFLGSPDQQGPYDFESLALYTGPSAARPVAVEAGDFDGDGKLELAVGNSLTSSNRTNVFLLDVDSSSMMPVVDAPVPALNIRDGARITDLIAGDFMPGLLRTPDLVRVSNPRSLVVLSDAEDLGIATAAVLNGPGWETCDVDVDDDPDSGDPIDVDGATATYIDGFAASSKTEDTVTIAANPASMPGMFELVVIPVGDSPTELRAADLDSDGFPDIAVINEKSGTVSILRNMPDITQPSGRGFSAHSELLLQADPADPAPLPSSIALADLDDDGDLDIAVVSTDAGDIRKVRQLLSQVVETGELVFTGVTDLPVQPLGVPLLVRESDLEGGAPGGELLTDDLVVYIDPTAAPRPAGKLVGFAGHQSLVSIDPPPCVADTNGDGMLSPADFSAWVAAFNANAPQCDQNGDGLCTPADFSAWVANYNAGCP